MNRFTVNRNTVDEDNVAIIYQCQDEVVETGLQTAELSLAISTQPEHSVQKESLGLIPPVQTKRSKRITKIFKKYGSTNGNPNWFGIFYIHNFILYNLEVNTFVVLNYSFHQMLLYFFRFLALSLSLSIVQFWALAFNWCSESRCDHHSIGYMTTAMQARFHFEQVETLARNGVMYTYANATILWEKFILN